MNHNSTIPRETRQKKIRHFNDPGHAHFLTFSCHGRRDLLTTDEIRLLFLTRLQEVCRQQRVKLWAYVLMPNHVHLLIRPTSHDDSIARFLHALKFPVGFHALRILRAAGHNPPRFWKSGPGFDENVRDVDTALAIADYIHKNPVRKRLVETQTEWRWSSARYWAGKTVFDLRVDNIV